MPGAYELVDNNEYGTHRDALGWLVEHYAVPLDLATGYVALGGLDALARLAETHPRRARLLLGAAPEAGALVDDAAQEAEPLVRDRFEESLNALRRQRDFSSFPPLRRATLERVADFLTRDEVQVRRYVQRFLHGKAYLLGTLDDASAMAHGAALVSSANLTWAGLTSNLELGMVHYQPNVVGMALRWFQGLWDDAGDFKQDLLELLVPPIPETDPQTVFLRALLELYGDDLEEDAEAARPGSALTRFQQDGYDRAMRILERYGGVIYADGVGTGKTEIGLQFINEYAREKGFHTLIISPAQLRDRLWQRRLDEANLPGQVVSYQQLANDRQLASGRPGTERILHVDKDMYRLIVVDEAHAFRNSDTTWYEAMDRLMGGTPKHLVLLTATPVNNTLWDLHSLMLLFGRHDSAFADPPLGIRSLRRFFLDAGANDPESISENILFPLIDAVAVRRDRAFLERHYPDDHFPDGTPVRFPRPVLIERRYDLDVAYPGIVRQVVAGIESLTMARYRPTAYFREGAREAADEAALAGLIQSGLLKRFESSWHSALTTIERMRGAIAVVVEGLEQHGGIPPLSSLKELALDVQGGATLTDVVAEALARDGAMPAEAFRDDFLVDVRKDLAILNALATSLEALGGEPDPKLATLWQVLSSTAARKVAIFTSYQDTAHYLQEALEAQPDLASGRPWEVVIGNETDANARAQALERFAPHSVTDDPHFTTDNEVDLLISTDILSEGQNLQEAQAVLSFDMPWNPQRVVQRNGRVIRLKSPHDQVYLYTLLPEQGDLDAMLGLEARLQNKIAAANAAFGMESPVLASMPAQSKIYADLAEFANRLAAGDMALLNGDGETSAAFLGEEFRARMQRALAEGEVARLRELPWGIGAAFVQRPEAKAEALTEPAVFFACRTRSGARYWRMVSASGEVKERDDLPMLRFIDPGNELGRPIPADLGLEALFDVAAADICNAHNELLDPAAHRERLPASQRWALEVLRSADAPAGKQYDEADLALGVGRDALVRRELSELRRLYEAGDLNVVECANRIVAVVESFGLRPVEPAPMPEPIGKEDLGVVCYQVVLPS